LLKKKLSFSFFAEVWPLFWPNALSMHIFLNSGSISIRIDILFWIQVTSSFNGFSTVISTRTRWHRMLTCNPKPSNEEYYSNYKSKENWIKTVALKVLAFFNGGCESSIMLMSQIKNAWNPNIKVIVRGRFHFFCLNIFGAGTIIKRLSYSILLKYDRYHYGLLLSKLMH